MRHVGFKIEKQEEDAFERERTGDNGRESVDGVDAAVSKEESVTVIGIGDGQNGETEGLSSSLEPTSFCQPLAGVGGDSQDGPTRKKRRRSVFPATQTSGIVEVSSIVTFLTQWRLVVCTRRFLWRIVVFLPIVTPILFAFLHLASTSSPSSPSRWPVREDRCQ
jgi:hypothetical protein